MALKLIQDGPLIIPYIYATVTPPSTKGASIPCAYTICMWLPAPVDAANEWLDFRLGHVSLPQSTEKGLASPVHAQIISASLDGIPIKFELNILQKANPSVGSPFIFEQMSGKEWETWVHMHMGSSSSGPIEIMYIINKHNDYGKKGKGQRVHNNWLQSRCCPPCLQLSYQTTTSQY